MVIRYLKRILHFNGYLSCNYFFLVTILRYAAEIHTDTNPHCPFLFVSVNMSVCPSQLLIMDLALHIITTDKSTGYKITYTEFLAVSLFNIFLIIQHFCQTIFQLLMLLGG